MRSDPQGTAQHDGPTRAASVRGLSMKSLPFSPLDCRHDQ